MFTPADEMCVGLETRISAQKIPVPTDEVPTDDRIEFIRTELEKLGQPPIRTTFQTILGDDWTRIKKEHSEVEWGAFIYSNMSKFYGENMFFSNDENAMLRTAIKQYRAHYVDSGCVRVIYPRVQKSGKKICFYPKIVIKYNKYRYLENIVVLKKPGSVPVLLWDESCLVNVSIARDLNYCLSLMVKQAAIDRNGLLTPFSDLGTCLSGAPRYIFTQNDSSCLPEKVALSTIPVCRIIPRGDYQEDFRHVKQHIMENFPKLYAANATCIMPTRTAWTEKGREHAHIFLCVFSCASLYGEQLDLGGEGCFVIDSDNRNGELKWIIEHINGRDVLNQNNLTVINTIYPLQAVSMCGSCTIGNANIVSNFDHAIKQQELELSLKDAVSQCFTPLFISYTHIAIASCCGIPHRYHYRIVDVVLWNNAAAIGSAIDVRQAKIFAQELTGQCQMYEYYVSAMKCFIVHKQLETLWIDVKYMDWDSWEKTYVELIQQVNTARIEFNKRQQLTQQQLMHEEDRELLGRIDQTLLYNERLEVECCRHLEVELARTQCKERQRLVQQRLTEGEIDDEEARKLFIHEGNRCRHLKLKLRRIERCIEDITEERDQLAHKLSSKIQSRMKKLKPIALSLKEQCCHCAVQKIFEAAELKWPYSGADQNKSEHEEEESESESMWVG